MIACHAACQLSFRGVEQAAVHRLVFSTDLAANDWLFCLVSRDLRRHLDRGATSGQHPFVMAASPALTQSRTASRRDPLARYRPRSFGQPSRWRFVRDRRALYLDRLAGSPSEAQKALIESLVELEWSALRAEAEGGMVAFREGRELRRLFLRALADFERSIPPPAAESPGAALDTFINSLPRAGEAA